MITQRLVSAGEVKYHSPVLDSQQFLSFFAYIIFYFYRVGRVAIQKRCLAILYNVQSNHGGRHPYDEWLAGKGVWNQ